jgi:hypothetical protein
LVFVLCIVQPTITFCLFPVEIVLLTPSSRLVKLSPIGHSKQNSGWQGFSDPAILVEVKSTISYRYSLNPDPVTGVLLNLVPDTYSRNPDPVPGVLLNPDPEPSFCCGSGSKLLLRFRIQAVADSGSRLLLIPDPCC